MNAAITYALGAALLFGLSTPLAKMLVGDVHPLLLAGLLYAGSGIGLSVLIAARAALKRAATSRIAWPQAADAPWLAAAILAGGIVAPVLLMFGLQDGSASATSLLLNLEGVFTALLAWFVFNENFDRRIAIGMALIVIGGAVLGWLPGEGLRFSTPALLICGACFLWGLDNNFTRKASSANALTLACLKGVVAGFTNLILAFSVGVPMPALSAILEAGAIGFVGYGLSLALFIMALRGLGTARTGAYFSLAPFFGMVLAIPIRGEPVTAQLVAAACFMGMGVWLHLTERHLHLHSHERLNHTHSHVHDEHHRHTHRPDDEQGEPHTHKHVHEPTVHSHPHFPDIHHQHKH